MNVIASLKKLRSAVDKINTPSFESEQQLLMLGRLLCETVASKTTISSLSDVEFKVFSQWGDDGIIQWLVTHLDIPHKTFIEFGVESYREANTRFLMMNNNWSGLVMDGGDENVSKIVSSEYYWKYNLTAKSVFIDKDNIAGLINSMNFDKEVGILHVDIDGNDYWIWKEIDSISPIIFIVEYNAVFGPHRAVTVPYDKSFYRTNAHYSNLYYGASLRALYQISQQKGYSFIGCNTAGNNAYFVRNDKLNDVVRAIPVEQGYMPSMFRESRDRDNKMTYLTGDSRLEAIRGLPVYNVDTNQIEKL